MVIGQILTIFNYANHLNTTWFIPLPVLIKLGMQGQGQILTWIISKLQYAKLVNTATLSNEPGRRELSSVWRAPSCYLMFRIVHWYELTKLNPFSVHKKLF